MSAESVRIGVVGGAGQMGGWLRRFWQARSCEVRYSDRGTEWSNEQVVTWSQVTFVAVPLGVTPRVLRELAPRVTGDRALVSIASLMVPSAAALADVPADAICAHPVFGPTVVITNGLPVIVAPVRGTRWADWLAHSFRAAGLVVQVATPEAHDARMALVQALLHSLYVALCRAFTSSDLSPAQALDWASPTLRLQLGLIARILGQDPELYADLVIGNPAAPAALDALVRALQDLAAQARAGDRAGFIAAFTAARAGFEGELTALADAAETALAHLG